jgi:hypothetical protein
LTISTDCKCGRKASKSAFGRACNKRLSARGLAAVRSCVGKRETDRLPLTGILARRRRNKSYRSPSIVPWSRHLSSHGVAKKFLSTFPGRQRVITSAVKLQTQTALIRGGKSHSAINACVRSTRSRWLGDAYVRSAHLPCDQCVARPFAPASLRMLINECPAERPAAFRRRAASLRSSTRGHSARLNTGKRSSRPNCGMMQFVRTVMTRAPASNY